MPYIEDDFLQELLSRNDIVDVIGSYVHLTKKGTNFWGLCPFHGEKTPSFSVKQDQQFFYCFGCHTGGNVIQFIQKHEKLDFIDAVTMLADRARIPMPESKNDKDYTVLRDKKEKMYNAARDAAKFYNNYLYEEGGKEGLEYLTERGLPQTIIKRFGLGMAPSGWNDLQEHMNELGYDDKLLHEIGLLGNKDERYFDSLRNRVIFPIIDHRSQVVGFAGRVLDDSLPKYINSPETPIYTKRNVLYGAHYLKRVNSIQSVMLVEGYMDVISLHKAGYQTAVASSGTALTEGQARLLKRYCDNVYVCYDGDSAGQKATWKAIEILHNEGLKVKVITLPDGKDPDDFAKRFGMAGINEQLDKAQTMNDYKISVIEKEYDLQKEEERKDFVIRVCSDVLSTIEDPVELSMYIKRMHLKTGFEETALIQQTDRAQMLRQKTDDRQKTVIRQQRISETADTKKRIYKDKSAKAHSIHQAERFLFTLAINHGECADIICTETKKDDYGEGTHRRIAEVILERYLQKKTLDAPQIFGLLGEEEVTELAISLESLQIPDDEASKEEIVRDCIEYILNQKKQTEIDEINKKLKDPSLDRRSRTELMEKLKELNDNKK